MNITPSWIFKTALKESGKLSKGWGELSKRAAQNL